MMGRSSWLSFTLVCLLLATGVSGATELEGFDEIEEEAPVVPEPVKVRRWARLCCAGGSQPTPANSRLGSMMDRSSRHRSLTALISHPQAAAQQPVAAETADAGTKVPDAAAAKPAAAEAAAAAAPPQLRRWFNVGSRKSLKDFVPEIIGALVLVRKAQDCNGTECTWRRLQSPPFCANVLLHSCCITGAAHAARSL